MTDQQPFYRLTPAQRRQQLALQANLTQEQLDCLNRQASHLGNELIENYVSDYQLPMGVVTSLMVNGKLYTVPMVTEEPSVIAAANNGAKRVRLSGGFHAAKQKHQVVGQVIISQDDQEEEIANWLSNHAAKIIKVANAARPSLVKRGGGAQKIQVRVLPGYLSLDIYIDVQEAMGANSVNTMAEAVGKYLSEKGFPVLCAILSNLFLGSLQKVSCTVKPEYLATKEMSGLQVAKRIAQLSELAQVDELRATTHNKGIMNGIDAAVIASGNDWRATEASAHAYAGYGHPYRGLASWRLSKQGLDGELTLPLSLGIVGGSIKLRQQSKINYQISGIQTSAELAAVVASIGLAQNLAALRALATTGIQAGHMQLQYRSLAMSVGASADEVDRVVEALKQVKNVDRSVAKKVLNEIRRG